MTPASPQDPIVAVVVVSERGVLIGRRRDGTPPWIFIAGKVEPGESPPEAAVREVMEEAGLQIAVEREIGRREHPATGRSMVYLACRPVGGTDATADGQELVEVRWISLPEAVNLLPDMHEPVRAYLAREIGHPWEAWPMTDHIFRPIHRSSPSRLAQQHWGEGRAIQDAETDGRQRAVSVEVGETVPPTWVAEALGLAEGESAFFRSRRYEIDGRPVQLATSWLPSSVARGTAIARSDTGPGGIYARLADTGHGPVRFTEDVRARAPLPDETERLELPAGAMVFEVIRHAFEESGRCVEVNRIVLDASAYVLHYAFPADGAAVAA